MAGPALGDGFVWGGHFSWSVSSLLPGAADGPGELTVSPVLLLAMDTGSVVVWVLAWGTVV